jgi:hypothetical protein
MEQTSTETSEDRADIKTRWKKGQSGNPQGRPRLRGAGLTLTALARTMMERPVEGADGERHTRLTEYMIDVVRCADAGDRQCRMFLLKAVDRGDRRRENAQRNAKKAKSEELRKFEETKADEISVPMPPLSPETEEEQTAKVSPTASAFAEASAGEPHSPAKPWRSRAAPPRRPAATPAHTPPAYTPPAGAPRKTQPDDASTYRRDPLSGNLVTPEGRVLSPEEEERLANPYWPHVSPHLKKAPSAGTSPGDSAGRESPVRESQAFDSARDFGSEKFSRKSAEAGADLETVH